MRLDAGAGDVAARLVLTAGLADWMVQLGPASLGRVHRVIDGVRDWPLTQRPDRPDIALTPCYRRLQDAGGVMGRKVEVGGRTHLVVFTSGPGGSGFLVSRQHEQIVGQPCLALVDALNRASVGWSDLDQADHNRAYDWSVMVEHMALLVARMRLGAGLSRSQLARQAGEDLTVLDRIEAGLHLPDLAILDRLAVVTGWARAMAVPGYS